jgi:hypothetical protein
MVGQGNNYTLPSKHKNTIVVKEARECLENDLAVHLKDRCVVKAEKL